MSQSQMPEIPGYTTVRLIGKGGMANVYEAIQENFGRKVALKVMHPEMASTETNSQRFLFEARMVANLSHPNIITVYDVGQYQKLLYIAMQYHAGGHLGEVKLKLKRSLVPTDMLRICLDVAKALSVAHAKGIVHRDLKPDNILFSDQGAAILSDFGIARDVHVDSRLTQVGLTVGTPKYMSPEQARGLNVDGRSDLYSLGIVLYELLTGKVPFDDRDPLSIAMKHCKEAPAPLPIELARYQSLIDRLLMKPVEKRFQKTEDLMMVLEKFLAASMLTKEIDLDLSEEPEALFDRLPETKKVTEKPIKEEGISKATDVYHEKDTEKGGFFFKKVTRTIVFNADDFDVFSKKFQRASDGIKNWHKQLGKQAYAVNFSIEAHPWIHKRVIDRFISNFAGGHGYGDFSHQGTITLHLYDQVNPVGKKFLIYHEGKRQVAKN